MQNARPETGYLSYTYPITEDLNASSDLCKRSYLCRQHVCLHGSLKAKFIYIQNLGQGLEYELLKDAELVVSFLAPETMMCPNLLCVFTAEA